MVKQWADLILQDGGLHQMSISCRRAEHWAGESLCEG